MLKRLVVIFLLILVTILATGCYDQKAPIKSFNKYTTDWEKQNFAAMYDQLSTATKKKVSKDDFIKRYQNIYTGMEVSKVSIKPQFPKKLKPDQKGQVSVPFTVSLQTLAGKVEFKQQGTLVQEGKVWLINWNQQMIFPGMKEGYKVAAQIIPASRGEIKDKNGNLLAANGKAASIGVVPKALGTNNEAAIQQIADILGLTPEQINNKLKAPWVKPDLFVPITELSLDDSERITNLLKIPGVTKQTVNIRSYPYKEATAHLTGYIGSITAEELKSHKDEGYSQSESIGKVGLEQIYEKRLRGQKGGDILLTDSAGKTIETIAHQDPKNGEDIQLTIDIDLQKELYNQLQGDTGTAAAINPKTGQVLSLVSSPGYDPNLFVLGMSSKQWNDLNNDPRKPLLNRFTHAYAPGSAFKPITASIGLKRGTINPNENVDIKGLKWQAGPSWGSFSVTRVSDPGRPVNLMDAFIFSDNIYFAKAALKIGQETFMKEAANFGIGEKLPFPIPITPSQLTNKGTFESDVQLADTGYGQAQVQMNPLHLALAYTTLVNEGNMPTPVLEYKKENVPVKYWHEKVITPEIANTILTDLTQVVENPQGTAHAALIPGLPLAGKTGTAELKQNYEDKNAGENGWFVAVNTNDPKLLIAMMVENVPNGQGSHYVVPKVRNVMAKFAK